MKKPNPRALSTLLTWTFSRHKWTGRNAKDRPHRRSYEIVVNGEGEFLVKLTGDALSHHYGSLARAKLHAANEEQSYQRTENGIVAFKVATERVGCGKDAYDAEQGWTKRKYGGPA